MNGITERAQPLRKLVALLLWLGTAAVLAVLLLGHADPTDTMQLVDSARGAALRIGWIALVLGLVAALAWPPFIPWLRLRWKQLHDKVDHDPLALREAAARLQHFDNPADRVTIGREALARREYQAAVVHLGRALELEPETWTTRYLLGRALLGAGQAEPAIHLLRQVVEHDQGHAFGDALRALGEGYMVADAWDDAERVLALHERLFGPARSVDLMRARIARQRSEPDEARMFLERAATRPKKGVRMSPEESLARARARVQLWFGKGGQP